MLLLCSKKKNEKKSTMEDLGVDDFDDFDSLPIKPRGKQVSPVKLPFNFEAKSPPGRLDELASKGRANDPNDRTALLASGMTFCNRFRDVFSFVRVKNPISTPVMQDVLIQR